MIDDTEKMETAEELQAQIKELQAKQAKIDAAGAAAEDALMLVEMPVADTRIRLSKFNDVAVKGVTPAELAFLVAEHHARAGGNPVLEIEPKGTVRRDPRHERARLCMKYNRDRVMEMFPGNEPSLPKTFRRAMESGINSRMKNEGYFFKMPLVDAAT